MSSLPPRGAGPDAIRRFHDAYPELESHVYDPASHAPELVARLGRLRERHGFVLLFHDTHHRMVTEPESMARYDVEHYDGVLAFGEVLCELYLSRGLVRRAWTWREAADIRRFHPMPDIVPDSDLVWIGNWGDGERDGVRYPESARVALTAAGIE